MNNAYELIKERGWVKEIALMEPETGTKWTYEELFNEVDHRSTDMLQKYKRGDTHRLIGSWTANVLFDYLAGEKIGLNCVTSPSPQLPIPETMTGYDEGGAMILFTSGTTGMPKGLVQKAERFATMQRKYDLSPNVPEVKKGERVGLFLPLVPAGFADMMKALMAGAELVLLQNRTPEQLWSDIAKYQIAHITMVVGAGTKLALIAKDSSNGLDLSNLKWVYLVGEPIMPKPYRQLNDVLHQLGCKHKAQLMYGSSEDGLPTATTVLDSGEIAYVPLYGVRYRIADPDENGMGLLELNPDGAQMLGYYNNPGKTAERILSDGWIRTEDIFKELDGGLFRPFGRNTKRFADGKLVFGLESQIDGIEGVFDLEILPNKSGKGYVAHIVPETGANIEIIKDAVNTLVWDNGHNDITVTMWDNFPRNLINKRDQQAMIAAV